MNHRSQTRAACVAQGICGDCQKRAARKDRATCARCAARRKRIKARYWRRLRRQAAEWERRRAETETEAA
jgi:hypothetical protein